MKALVSIFKLKGDQGVEKTSPGCAPQSSRITIKSRFHHFAIRISGLMGSHWAFFVAGVVILGWALTGPLFGFSDTWQLVINTGTTIVTFLMVFVIQNTQNRDARAMHLKLDELIRSVKSARNDLVDLEDLTDEELDRLQDEFSTLRKKASEMKKIRKQRSA